MALIMRCSPKKKSIVIDLTGSDDEDTTGKDTTSRPNNVVSTLQKPPCMRLQKHSEASGAQNTMGTTIDMRSSLSMSKLTTNDRESTRNVGDPPNLVTPTKRKNPEHLRCDDNKRVKRRRRFEVRQTSPSINSTRSTALKQSKIPTIETSDVNSTLDPLTIANNNSSQHFQSGQTRHHKATRVSVDGQIKKLPRNGNRSRERLAEILEKHVFIHVRQAVRPFRDKLSREERARIGADAVRLVVEHPDFEKHFKENGNAILPGFESILATQMCSYVNGCARHILGDEAVDRLLHYPKINKNFLTPPQKDDLENPSCSSNSEHEEIFCQQQEPLGRLNSFSPSTSLSIDQTEVETEKKRKDVSRNEIEPSSWPARTARASSTLSAKPSRQNFAPLYNTIVPENVECLQLEDRVSNPFYAEPIKEKFIPLCNMTVPDNVESMQIEEDRASSLLCSKPVREKSVLMCNMTRPKDVESPQIEENRASDPLHTEPVSENPVPLCCMTVQDKAECPKIEEDKASKSLYAKRVRKISVPLFSTTLPEKPKSPETQEDIDPRPYMGYQDRDALLVRIQSVDSKSNHSIDDIFPHIPFSEVEVEHLIMTVEQLIGKFPRSYSNFTENITNLMDGRTALIPKIVNSISYGKHGFVSVRALLGRSRSDIEAFLLDAANDTVSESESLPTQASHPEISESQKKINPINRMLRHREIDGIFPDRIRRGLASYREIVHSSLEDSLVSRSNWADCSNDIAAITWINDNVFLLGALTHSDPHNMQYNKPGNLLLGSVVHGTVRSFSDHRIERPIISKSQNTENALESMRATQSPWLYTSVVSTAFSSISGYSFTSSYDNTAKVWRVSEDGLSMRLCGTWRHEAKVNFVVTSEHHGRVATASGTSKNAVRVYHFNENAIGDSPYDEYGGNMSQEYPNDPNIRQSWAYQPATIKWARAACVANLLLVGYSPRANSGDDSDIPDDKVNTGELCVWNSADGARLNVSSARMQNVFDVVWHPTQPVFAAATSPSGSYDGDRTKTQVRIFALKEHTFNRIMALDCPALDITELTIMPNSSLKAYVTASCTDGCTYIWDTAQGEDPIHILRHGESLDNPEPNLPLELADGGVTFSAWGADVSRFYTGATDGKLIAWDVRKSPGNAFVRKVLELSGGISSGAFSKDFKRLLIGDATGKIHLLEIDDDDLREDEDFNPDCLQTKDSVGKSRLPLWSNRYPKLIIPHPEPAPSEAYQKLDSKRPVEQTSKYFLDQGILQIYPGKGVFKGPNYHQLGLYRAEAHENKDTQQPLIPEVMTAQQFMKSDFVAQSDVPKIQRLEHFEKSLDSQLHAKNLDLEFNFLKLTPKTKQELRRDRVELDWDDSQFLQYELTPRSNIFRIGRERRAHSSLAKRLD
ncbi:hypothetical protein K3495_g112 [Podosphaera aphanis]|nr:hypothetical protein K3495_g112 [Podosphaera aphanis]